MAAALEFAQKGFEGASFNQIIEAAEISKGAAYYYFDDKTDLYTTVIDHAIARLAEFFGDFTMDRLDADNFWDVLQEYSYKSLHRVQEHPNLTKLMRTVWQYARSHPDAPGGTIVFRAARNWVKTFLQRGQELGVIRDDLPDELMIELLMGLGAATDAWVLDHVDEMSDDDILRYSKQMLNIHKRICQPYDPEVDE